MDKSDNQLLIEALLQIGASATSLAKAVNVIQQTMTPASPTKALIVRELNESADRLEEFLVLMKEVAERQK